MRSAALLVRPEKPHLPGGRFLLLVIAGQHGTDIVSIRYRDIALAGSRSLDLVTIPPLRRTGKVRNKTAGPLFCLLFSVIGNHGGNE